MSNSYLSPAWLQLEVLSWKNINIFSAKTNQLYTNISNKKKVKYFKNYSYTEHLSQEFISETRIIKL